MSQAQGSFSWTARLRHSKVGESIEMLGGMVNLGIDAFKGLFRRPPSFSSTVDELYQLGVKSFLIVAVTAITVGLVMTLQFGYGFARFGAKLYTPKVVTLAIVREMGPIFTALMFAGRVGAGITSEVGSMKVTQQIDAIRALGTDPLQKIVLPKIIACLICAPILTIIADLIGVSGGLLVSSNELGLSPTDYFFKAFEIIRARDVIGGLLKALIFGGLIGLVGCYFGMNTKGGTQGVGSATTRSVVTASIFVMIADFIVTKFLWIVDEAIRTGRVI